MKYFLDCVYDLRVTLLDKKTWEYKDLYFHFFSSEIANKWIKNFLNLKNTDHSFREREISISGSVIDLNQKIDFFNDHISQINKIYDISIPIFTEYSQDKLNLLHRYYEEYGNRLDIIKTEKLENLFFKFNTLIHDLEYKIRCRHSDLQIKILASFDPRIDYKLEDRDFESNLPMLLSGNLYLGYNTLGKGLTQAIDSSDKNLIDSRGISNQEFWSNEILISLTPQYNPSAKLLNYKKQWDNLQVNDVYQYGNFSHNREGYIPLAEMIPEQKDKLYSFFKGIDESLKKFDAVHSIDLVRYQKFRDLDTIKRIPVWKYPVKVQGPEIQEIRNEGTVFITWLLNNICNYACRYCPEILHNGKNVKYDWNILEPFLDHLNSFYQRNNINFSFTGGEPTLSPFFPTMIKKIYDLGHRAGITTNLSRTQRYIEENFVYLDYASCSFHPAYEIKNNTADEYIEKLKISSGITATDCRIMMDPDYWNQTIDFIEKIKELKTIGINPVMIDSQYGYSSSIISEVKYTEEQLDWFSKFNYQKEYKKPDNELYKIKENFSFAIFEDHEEKIIDPQTYINRGQTNFWNYQCMIGRESLFINHDGKIQRANCGTTGIAGTLDDWKSIDWNRLKSPISCPALMCHCGSDVLVSKKKVD